jgi:hypothetical protein
MMIGLMKRVKNVSPPKESSINVQAKPSNLLGMLSA